MGTKLSNRQSEFVKKTLIFPESTGTLLKKYFADRLQMLSFAAE